MSEIMKTDLAERIDYNRFCLFQISQTLSEELNDTSNFQTLSRKSIKEEISEKPSRKLSTPLTISQKPQAPSAELHFTFPKDNSQIFASKYQTYLLSKEELQWMIEENLK